MWLCFSGEVTRTNKRKIILKKYCDKKAPLPYVLLIVIPSIVVIYDIYF